MKPYRLRSLAALSFVACLSSTAVAAPPTPLDKAFYQMYDLDFEGAHRTLGEWTKLHPDDPVGPAADAAAYLFAEFDRLHILESEFFLHDSNFRNRLRLTPDAASAQAFERQLACARRLAGEALAHSPQNADALFAQVLVYGLRSDYDGLIEKKYLSSLASSRVGRHTAERLLAIDANYADAWLAVGVENYLLSLKPLPVRWFLQLSGNVTNRDLGLAKLRITAEKGRYLKPLARLMLAVAALRERDFKHGRRILRSLQAEFPHNRLYREELARLQ